jgi:hypothetical protein
MKTWKVEMMVAATVLCAVVFISGRYENVVEWIGASAVLLTFAHMQVADRLAESAAYGTAGNMGYANVVGCFAWARRYLVGKEILWMAYFILHQSWSALAGVGLFLLYPVWRAWWRRP